MKKGTWEIMAEMPKIWPETSTRVNAQEKHKENHAKHGIITLLKIKDKEKNLESSQSKRREKPLEGRGFLIRSRGAGEHGCTLFQRPVSRDNAL